MLFSIFIICVLLGSIVGFAAGLLGIGGGLIIVPALVYLLPLAGVDGNVVMPMALATSLATIVITSFSAALAHHRNKNIPWSIAKTLMIAIACGSLLGAYIADSLSVNALKNTFAIAVFILAIYMFFSVKNTKKNSEEIETINLPSAYLLKAISFFTGILASLMGISGGVMLIPILSYFTMPLRQAIGVATVCGLTVAVFGVSGYILAGWNNVNLPDYSLGYVYLPALLGMVITSSVFAPLGVKWATRLPVRTLKKAFVLFLMIVAIKMIFS
ncbi:MAG: sulfite exporter TauE/SafE family protein [Colwellia sp.]|nr:sulfite exporter TauE/SafE family protein [Colwellia sp.]